MICLIIYIIGFILVGVLWYSEYLREQKEITLGHLIVLCLFCTVSWAFVFGYVIHQSDNIILWRKRD